MNIETVLDERLWHAIQSTYNDRNFTGAVMDAIYFLSDLIRDKTGLQSDGTTLAGQAFGGKSPRLKVNKLQTESEKNIQAGLEQLLRGLYQAIRNPRSHGKHTDKQNDSDAIIMFINFLVGVIDQSKTPFTKSEFLKRVFDSQFVQKERYAELLASEVPQKHRLEVMLDVLRNRETGEGGKLKYFVSALFPKLTKEDKADLYSAISDELKITDKDSAIWTIFQIFPDDCISYFDETARLRTENKLIQSIKGGRFDSQTRNTVKGALGTWAMNRCCHFLLKDELINTLTTKLRSSDPQEHTYVFHYFWDELVKLAKPPSKVLVYVITEKLRAGNKDFYDKLFAEQEFGDSKWVEPFKKDLESFKEREPTADIQSDDDVPF
jgi:uncharacterized protein (TIGR02391 family)